MPRAASRVQNAVPHDVGTQHLAPPLGTDVYEGSRLFQYARAVDQTIHRTKKALCLGKQANHVGLDADVCLQRDGASTCIRDPPDNAFSRIAISPVIHCDPPALRCSQNRHFRPDAA
jgi:hypothetical protein